MKRRLLLVALLAFGCVSSTSYAHLVRKNNWEIHPILTLEYLS